MLINLDNVVPRPIPHKIVEKSSVWNTSLQLKSKTCTLISAQSGMGKSTLLHILYGIRKDYDGRVLLNDKNISEQPKTYWEEIRLKEISILFQDLRLFPNLTARENLDLIPLSNPSAPSIESMSKQLGMNDFLDQTIQTLSHGQRQRIALIRSLRKPFKILLLDEPFSHLDEKNQKLACDLILDVLKVNDAGLLLSSLGSAPPLPFNKTLLL